MDLAFRQQLYAASEQYIYKHTAPRSQSSPRRPWWTDELEVLRGLKSRAGRESHRWRGIREHPAHEMRKSLEREYARVIYLAKRTHEGNEANKERRKASRELPDPGALS